MNYVVVFLAEAEEDIFEIYKHILINDSPAMANDIFQSIEKTCQRLSVFPKRGHTPRELAHIGLMNYKEIDFKSYRIIYEIEGRQVYVHGVFDGRRDLQELLEKRLLR